jgi:hypothetical protein
MPAQTVIQIRRDTAANWESTDPTLASGEIGFDTTNNQIKIGNGSDEWTVLDYASGGASVQISETAPADPDAGNVWFNSTDGRAYIYYDSVWVDLNPGIAGPAGKFTVSETAPEDATSGDGWFNSATARLFIRYDSFWVEATSNYIGPAGPTGPAGPDGGFDSTQVVESKSANYTLTSADAGKLMTNSAAITITVQGIELGKQVDFLQTNAAQITFAAGSGMTLNSKDGKLKTNAQYSPASIKCIATDTYVLIGDLGA